MEAVLKYQEGGDLSLFLIDYTPFTGVQKSSSRTATTSTSKSSDDDDETKNSVGLKDLLGLLKDLKGLPTEIDIISKKVLNMFEDMMLMNNGKISTSQLVTTYLSLLRDIKIAEQNKEMYEEKRKKVADAEGLDDPAMDALGRVYVLNINTGEVLIKTPSEYKELLKDEEHIALTNSQLLSLRQYDPNFAFKNDIFNVVDNGIGIKQITSFILSISNKIGTTELQQEGYSTKKANQIVNGLQQLDEAAKQGISIDGLYKQKLITSDLYNEAKMALDYIWSTLPANAKNRLRIASAEMGNENVEAGAYNLIGTLIESGLKTSRAYSIDLVKDPNSSGSDSSSNSGSDTDGIGEDAKGKELDAVSGFALGMGEVVMTNINPGSSYQATHFARKSIVTDHSGKPLGQYSTLKDVSDGAFAATLDFNNMTFGGARIASYNRAFLENATIYRMDLPIDVAYQERTGMIRPDLRLAKKLEALDAAIQRGEIDPNNVDQVNAKCAELELPPKYAGAFTDSNGQTHLQLNTIAYASFGVLDGLVDENAFEDKDALDKSLVREVEGTRRDAFKEYMKTTDKNYSLDEDFWFFGGGDNLYEGKIFIPATSDPIAASYGGKHYKLPQQNAIQVAQRYSDDQARQKFNKALPLSSYN